MKYLVLLCSPHCQGLKYSNSWLVFLLTSPKKIILLQDSTIRTWNIWKQFIRKYALDIIIYSNLHFWNSDIELQFVFQSVAQLSSVDMPHAEQRKERGKRVKATNEGAKYHML